MKASILKRLDALEKQRDKELAAAERKAFLAAASPVLLAYHVGDLRQEESSPLDAFARALGYTRATDFAEPLAKRLLQGPQPDLQRRNLQAWRKFWAKARCAPESLPAGEEAIIRMAEELPDKWRRWISEVAVRIPAL